MIEQHEAIRLKFWSEREVLQMRRVEIAAELNAIDEAKKQSNDAIVALSGTSKNAMMARTDDVVDYIKIPSDLDAALEKLGLCRDRLTLARKICSISSVDHNSALRKLPSSVLHRSTLTFKKIRSRWRDSL